ncbi:hypothetical protein [Streptomyces sp. NPDC126514]|uniref:hypothetical protein n=1 Tax=Streptomyces sp. NPDC126514 TaxID=3155210 RepID=UPI0033199A91
MSGLQQGPGWGPPPPQRPNRTNAIIIWTAVALIALIVGAGVLVAQSDDDGGSGIADPVACRAAMKESLREAMAAGPEAPTPAPPSACLGLDEGTVEQLVGETMAEYWESPEAERLFEDAWQEAAESAYPSP